MSELRVAHSFEVWLPPTMMWAYNHVRFAPGVEALVLATGTANLDRYPWAPLATTAGPLEKASLRVAQRAGRRAYPRAYWRALRSFRPRLLHSHFGYRGWSDAPLARRLGVAHVVTFYGHDVTMFPRTWPVWRERYLELFDRAAMVFCEGPFMAGSVVKLGCPPDKVHVQRLGVEVERLPSRPRALAEGEPVRILVAGAFRAKKNIPGALEAVATCRARGRDIRVTIAGDSNGSAGEDLEKARIRLAVREFGLDDIVTFAGMMPYDDLIAAMHAHHLFLSPSVTAPDGDSEGGCPVSIIEAAATGMPVVSTTHCDIPQAVEDGVSGLLAPEGDQQALGGLLDRLVTSPELWEDMGVAAGRLARERFDVRACAAEMVERYREVLAAARDYS